MSNNLSLVSIIMPVYNSEDFLEASIQSVLNQSYKNWELIIVDDGSTDASLKIIKKFQREKSEIRLLINNENMGIAATRNKGIGAARGEFVAFLDSDDRWQPKKLEKQIAFMKKEAINFSCTSYFVSDEFGTIIGERNFIEKEVDYKELLKTNLIGCLTVMVKTDLIKQYKMPKLKHEDYATWLNILRDGNNVYFMNEKLAFYTKRGKSVSANKFNTVSWVWDIFRESQNFSVLKSFFYLLRFLFFTSCKYLKSA